MLQASSSIKTEVGCGINNQNNLRVNIIINENNLFFGTGILLTATGSLLVENELPKMWISPQC